MSAIAFLNTQARRKQQVGFTLIELLVTMALLAVMLSLAAPSFITFQRNSELTSSANSFVAALSAARAEAMKRQLRAFVIPGDGTAASTDWSTGWTVFVDVNSNVSTGSTLPDSADIIVAKQAAVPSTVTVDTSVIATPFADSGVRYAMFNGSGFMTLIGGSFPTGGVLGLDLQSVSGEKRRIIANTTGRLRVCKPGTGGDAGCNLSDPL